MFEVGKIYTGRIAEMKFRFKAVSKTPGGNVYFQDLDDFFWYLNCAVNPLVILGVVEKNEAFLMDHKGYGIALRA